MSMGLDLWPSYQRLSEELTSFHAVEKRLDEKSPDIVAWLSEQIAGAQRYKDHYRSDAYEAGKALQEALKSLHCGDQKRAARFLGQASEHIENARSFWQLYLHATIEGADTAQEGLVASGISVASGGIGGFLGLAIGIHGAVLSWLPAKEEDHSISSPFSSDSISDQTLEEPTSADRAEQKSVFVFPKSDEKRTEKAKDKEEEYRERQILAVLDGPSSEEEIGKAIKRFMTQKISKRPDPAHEASVAEVNAVAEAARKKFEGNGKEALIAEARRVLAEWKKNKGAVHDYAHFLIATETEAVEPNFKMWEEHRSAIKDAVKQSGEGKESVRNVMSRLFEDYLQSYARGNAKLTDFLEGRGGNCEAQTKLIVSALTAGGIQLPEGNILAVQVFADHLQPVIYDQKSGEVWNLMTNSTFDHLDAPLFDPHILYYAYLQKEGGSSPVEAKDLLIRAPERTVWEELPIVSPLVKLFQHRGGLHIYKTNSNLSFASLAPGNGIHFAGNEAVPERARPSSPYYTPPKRVYAVTWKEAEAMGRDYWVPSTRNFLKETMKKNVATYGFALNYFDGPTVVVFESEEDVNHYNTLPSDKERIAYLAFVYHRHLATMLDTPDMKQALEFFDRPAVVKNYQPDDILDALNAVFQFRSEIEKMISRIQEIFPGLNEEELIPLLPESPLVAFYNKKQKAFQNKVKEHPLAFILLADKLSPQARKYYIQLITLAGSFRTADFSAGTDATREALGPLLADKGLLGLREKRKPERAKAEWMTLPLEPIEVELVEADILVPEGLNEVKRKQVGSARHKISPETLVEFVLNYYDEGEVASRWSPRLSRAFLKMNGDGKDDDRFGLIYPTLKQHYPASEQDAVPDPYQTLGGPYVGRMGYPAFNVSCRIPRDFEPILAQIMKRRQEKENEEKVVAREKTNSGHGILFSQ